MLLQRLYNWIKYKSLPSSFLFKNRLFIERNTKHRRIYSIFGALIRNSKWGNFELSNLKLQFRLNYTKYLLWIFIFLIFIFFLWFFKKYYLYTYAFNSVALFVWLSIDTIDYYLSFSIWCVTAAIAIVTNWIYSYFLERVDFKRMSVKTIFSNVFFDELVRSEDVEDHQLLFATTDLKYLFYHWISHLNHRNNTVFLENFFESDINKNQWNNCYDFFIKLFKVTYFCDLNGEAHTVNYLHYTLANLYPIYLYSNIKNLFIHHVDTNINNKYSTLMFWYFLNNFTNYHSYCTINTPSLRLLKIKNNWNLQTFDTESNNYVFLNNNLLGEFYLSSFSFNELSQYSIKFVELWNFSLFIKNQLNTAKWNRWLYKYSILHRRFLKNSHKITLTKKLFASGFYDNKYFNKNAWNSAHIKNIDKKFLNNLSSVYYKNLFTSTSTFLWQTQNANVLRTFSSKKNINLFSFYENSYLWVTKRFYYFNTIPSNNINSTVIIKQDDYLNNNKIQFQNNNIWNTVLTSYLNNLYSFNIVNILNFNQKSLFTNYINKNNNSVQTPNIYHLKDLYLLFDDKDLLTQEFLDISYWTTTVPSTIKNNPLLSNYLTINSFNFKFTNSSSIFILTSSNKPTFFLTKNTLIDNNYLFDIVLLSYFY